MFSKKLVRIAVTALLSTVLLNQSAQAKEHRLVQQMKKSAAFLAKTKKFKKISPVCADFTGDWVGVCVEQDGHQESSEMIIEQHQCDSITEDGDFFNINGLNTLSNTPSPNSEWPFASGVAVSVIWNDAQTRLYGSGGFTLAGAFSGVSTNEMWLEGDSLRRKDTAGYLLDPTGVPSPWQFVLSDCTYTRR